MVIGDYKILRGLCGYEGLSLYVVMNSYCKILTLSLGYRYEWLL